MMVYLLALLIGVVAGLRAFTALAAVSVATCIGWIVPGGWPALLGSVWAAAILALLALAELVGDKLASTPDRRLPVPLGVRIISGVVAGATIGSAAHTLAGGGAAGLAGAVIGALAGYEGRKWLARRLGRSRPAALIEDCVAIGAALVAVLSG